MAKDRWKPWFLAVFHIYPISLNAILRPYVEKLREGTGFRFRVACPDVVMQHEWILEVLKDMQAYAERNGLTATAAMVAQTSHAASREICTSCSQTSGTKATRADRNA